MSNKFSEKHSEGEEMLKDHQRTANFKSLAEDLEDVFAMKEGSCLVPDVINPEQIIQIDKEVLKERVLWAHDSAMMQARSFIYTLVGHAVSQEDAVEDLMANVVRNEVYFLADHTQDKFKELEELSKKGTYHNWLVKFMRDHMDEMTKQAFEVSFKRVKEALRNAGVKGVDDVSFKM